MMKDINSPDFKRFCETTDPLELVRQVTNGNIRGLDRLALRTVLNRNHLPSVVVNVLLVYYFNTFANQVYDRNDLARIYDYWVTKKIYTFSNAIVMTRVDIKQLLPSLK